MRSRQGNRGIRGPRGGGGGRGKGRRGKWRWRVKLCTCRLHFMDKRGFFCEKMFGDSGNSNECLLFVSLAREKRVSGNGSGWLKIERVWNWGRDEGGG